jgi:hypothetical protein
MRKEVVFAIIAGISLGLLFAFGSWKVAQIIKKKNLNQNITSQINELPKSIKNTIAFSVDYPENNSTLGTNLVKITGSNTPSLPVIISTPTKDHLTKADLNGKFEAEVALSTAINSIIITNFDENKKLNLIYWKNEIVNPKSYIGTITDITDKTVQIRSRSGEIQQAKIEEDAKIYNSLKDNQEIKQQDLAIGDFIIAIGDINGNKVLKAQIIITAIDFKEENNLEFTKGKFVKATSKDMTIVLDSGEEKVILLPKSWDGPNTKELKPNQNIITVSIKTAETSTLRTLFTDVE